MVNLLQRGDVDCNILSSSKNLNYFLLKIESVYLSRRPLRSTATRKCLIINILNSIILKSFYVIFILLISRYDRTCCYIGIYWNDRTRLADWSRYIVMMEPNMLIGRNALFWKNPTYFLLRYILLTQPVLLIGLDILF